MLLKKSVPSCSARFSLVVSPPTKTHERLVGRSERVEFLPAARQQHAATFSTTSPESRRRGDAWSRVRSGSGSAIGRREVSLRARLAGRLCFRSKVFQIAGVRKHPSFTRRFKSH